MHTFVPETSVVGMLLNRTDDYVPIANLDKNSSFLTNIIFFTWKIEPCKFVSVKEVSSTSNIIYETTQTLLQDFTVDQTTQFINIIFEAADKAGLHTVNDLTNQPLNSLHHLQVVTNQQIKKHSNYVNYCFFDDFKCKHYK